MNTLAKFPVLVLLLILLCSCAHRLDTPDEQQARINRLSIELQQLSPTAPPDQAQQLAALAVATAADLREQYGVRLTPWVHNIEVNSGTRSRGLCFHYAKDLAKTLQPAVEPYWQIHHVWARPQQPLEHNAIVISAPDAPWDSGIVLDAWRNAGVLYFGAVQTDKYPWQLKKKRRQQ